MAICKRITATLFTALTAGLLLVSEAFALSPQEETRVENLLTAVGKQEQLILSATAVSIMPPTRNHICA